MTPYSIVGLGLAAAQLAEAKAWGNTISFSHRGAAGVTLYAIAFDEQIGNIEEGGSIRELRTRKFQIPTQTSFLIADEDTEPVTPGDTLTFQDRDYQIVQPIRKVANGYIYEVTCIERKRLSGGVQ